MYHCTRFGHCLPVYDHYCGFLKTTIYLRTIKPYLYVLVFLPLDAFLSMSISCFVLARYKVLAIPFATVVILSAMLMAWTCFKFTQGKIRLLGFKNCVQAEDRNERWYLAFKYTERGETRLHVKIFYYRSPYDLGIAENLSHVLGRHWWQWLLFFARPERVRRYGHYHDRDVPYADWVNEYRTEFLMGSHTGPLPKISRGPVPSRRQQQRSSAVSDYGLGQQGAIELNTLRTRRTGGSSSSHVEDFGFPFPEVSHRP